MSFPKRPALNHHWRRLIKSVGIAYYHSVVIKRSQLDFFTAFGGGGARAPCAPAGSAPGS